MVEPGIVKMFVSIIALVWLLCSTTAIKVPVTLTEVTTPTIKFNSNVWSMISHPGDSQLLVITDRYAVWTFDPNTKQKTLIAGSASQGYQEGRAENARFHNPAGLAHFNDSTIIVTDENNYCVRLVNLETRWTERYAGVCKSSGYKDGNRLTAQFNWMWGITQIGTDFYICETAGKRLRRLSGNTVSTVTSVTNLFYGLTSAGNKLFYSFSHGLGEFDLDSRTSRTLTGTTSSGSTDGSLSSARFANPYYVVSLTDTVFLVADTFNNAVRIVDQNKKTVSSITVSSPTYSLLLYNGDVLVGIGGGKIEKFPIKQLPVDLGADISCGSDKTLSLPTSDYVVLFVPNLVTRSDSVVCKNCPSDQNLTFGVHRFAYKYYNHNIRNYSKTCNQTVTVGADAVTLECPENLNLSLSRDSPGINLTLAQPDINGTRLECINCPPANQFLSEGVHDMRYTYQDQLTKLNFSCGYLINIKKPAPICHNETKHMYLLRNQTSTEKLTVGNCKLKLEPGITKFEVDDGCYHDYKVHEWSKMERRAFLEAEYLFDCTSLSKLAVSIIKSDAKQHTKYLNKYCPDCGVNVSSPEIRCLDDKLVLIWKTEVTGSQKISPSDMRNKLEDSLVQFHDKYPEMDISVIRTTSRVASPVRLKSGLYLNIVVRTSCLEDGYFYNSQTDTCEKMTVSAAVIQCSKDMELILPQNVNELNITLPQPQVNETRLSCINCPDRVQTLDEGVHNVSFTYMDTVYNKTVSCHYTINVTIQSAPDCQNETRRLFIRSGQNQTDEVQFGDTGAIRFDVGVHKVKIRDDCIITYIVNEMSNMERRVELQAEYPVKCSTLKSVSFSVIDSQLLVHTQYLQKYCPVCQLDASPNPEITCTNDSLISTWKTGISGDNQVLNENIKNKLNTALILFRNKYPVMDITVISTLPRIVSPVKDSEGLNVRVVVTTTCLDKGFIYNKQYDVCEQVI